LQGLIFEQAPLFHYEGEPDQGRGTRGLEADASEFSLGIYGYENEAFLRLRGEKSRRGGKYLWKVVSHAELLVRYVAAGAE
jgi:hypothetical protein